MTAELTMLYHFIILLIVIVSFKVFCQKITKEQRNKNRRVLQCLHLLIHGFIVLYMQEVRQIFLTFFGFAAVFFLSEHFFPSGIAFCSDSDEKSSETVTALLNSPQNAPNLEEVLSLREPREEQGSPSRRHQTPPAVVDPIPNQTAPEDPIASALTERERDRCLSYKQDPYKIDHLNDEFEKAERDFPGLRGRYSKPEVIDQVMEQFVSSDEARNGSFPQATKRQYQLYAAWLKRAIKGSNYTYKEGNPPTKRDIDLSGKIYEFFQKENNEG
jgi:hypothetical protein